MSTYSSFDIPSFRSQRNDEFLNIHGDVEKSTFVTYVREYGIKKLLQYDLKLLVQLGGIPSMFCAGTVFTMDWNVAKSLAVTIVISVASAIFASVVDLGDTSSLESLATQINQIVPFVLGLYVSLTLTRWWALRVQALGRVFQALSDLCMSMAVALPEAKWAPLHHHLLKLGLASIDLVSNAAKGQNDMSRIRDAGLLTHEEVGILEPVQLFQRAVAIWSWIMRIGEWALTEGKQPVPKIVVINKQCCAAREGIQTIHTYLLTQLPFAYVHLLAWLVNVQNVVIAVKSGIVIELALKQGQVAKVVQETTMCVLVCLIYQGLLSISYVVQDPFGDDLLDFPVTAYTQYVLASIKAMHLAVSECHALDKVKATLSAAGHQFAPDAKTNGHLGKRLADDELDSNDEHDLDDDMDADDADDFDDVDCDF